MYSAFFAERAFLSSKSCLLQDTNYLVHLGSNTVGLRYDCCWVLDLRLDISSTSTNLTISVNLITICIICSDKLHLSHIERFLRILL